MSLREIDYFFVRRGEAPDGKNQVVYYGKDGGVFMAVSRGRRSDLRLVESVRFSLDCGLLVEGIASSPSGLDIFSERMRTIRGFREVSLGFDDTVAKEFHEGINWEFLGIVEEIIFSPKLRRAREEAGPFSRAFCVPALTVDDYKWKGRPFVERHIVPKSIFGEDSG